MKVRTYADSLQLLEDMRDYAIKAKRFSTGRDFADLQSDEAYRFSVLYALQVVGEAASRVPSSVAAMEGRIPWKLIAGFRHAVVHGYGEVKLDKVQSILEEELESLVRLVDEFIPRVEAKGDAPLPEAKGDQHK